MSNVPDFHDVTIVGMHFRELEGVPAKAIVANLFPPVELQFQREPDNEYDEYAIKVFFNNQHIGYVESKSACFIAPYLDDGLDYKCVVQRLEERRKNLHPICSFLPVETA